MAAGTSWGGSQCSVLRASDKEELVDTIKNLKEKIDRLEQQLNDAKAEIQKLQDYIDDIIKGEDSDD